MAGPIGPPPTLTNSTDTLGRTEVYEQTLTVDVNGKPKPCGSFATAVRVLNGGERLVLSVANQQANAQYPPPSTRHPTEEAAAAAHVADNGLSDLWAAHTKWWHDFYTESMVSVADTRVESFYAINMYKLGSATRRTGTPIMSLVGPFRMDMQMRCPASQGSITCKVNCPPGKQGHQLPIYGSQWLGLWFDYNVQMAYWPVFPTGHADLAESLGNGLHAGLRALQENTLEVSGGVYNDSVGVVAGAGIGLRQHNVGVPGKLKPFAIPNYRHAVVSVPAFIRGETTNGMPFASHTVWSSCAYRGNISCMRERLLPLFEPALRWYNHYLTYNGTSDLHLPPTHSSDYPGPDGWDCNLDIQLLTWMCRMVINAANSSTWSASYETLAICAEISSNLTAPPIDNKTRSLEVYRDIPFAVPHRSIGHMFQFFPLNTWTNDMPHRRDILTGSLDNFIRVNGMKQRNDFYWTGVVTLSALARRSEAALGNLSEWLDSAKYNSGTPPRLGQGEILTPTTMYAEGSNPTLEGGVDPVVGIVQMLLQAFPDDPVKSDEMVIRIFPAVSKKWPAAVFYKLRAEHGLVVSASRQNSTTEWLQVSSQPEEDAAVVGTTQVSFVIEVDAIAELTVMKVTPSARVEVRRLGSKRVRVTGLPAGGTLLLARAGAELVVRPLSLSNTSQPNWWGPQPNRPAPTPAPVPASDFTIVPNAIGKAGTGVGTCDCNGHVQSPAECVRFAAAYCESLGVMQCRAFSLSERWKKAMVAQIFTTNVTTPNNWTTYVRVIK